MAGMALNTAFRNPYRIFVRWRFTHMADLINFPRLCFIGKENGFRYPQEIAGITPNSNNTVPFVLG